MSTIPEKASQADRTKPETNAQILEGFIAEYKDATRRYVYNPVEYPEGQVVRRKATERLCQQVKETGIDTDTLVRALTATLESARLSQAMLDAAPLIED